MTVDDPGAARYARVQAAMARRGVGAVCLASPQLGAFASGVRRVRVAGSGGTVPWVVVAAGAPSAVVFTTDPDGAPAWMPRSAVEPLRWDRDRQIGRIAELVGGTTGDVAFDVASPALETVLAGRRLVDAVPLLADATAPRSPAEVAAIAAALAAARAGVRAGAGRVAAGADARAVRAAFAAAMAPVGTSFPLHEGIVRPAADLVQLEVGVWLGEHAGVAGDTAAAGRDVAGARRAWDEALCAIATACRAGARAADLRAAAARAGATQAGLLAHGLGVGIEPPLVDLATDDDVPLRAGTVLVVAPVVAGFRATRALVVTETSHRWIEPAP